MSQPFTPRWVHLWWHLGHAKDAEREYQQALAIDQGVAIGSSPPAEIEYTRADSYFGLGSVEAALAVAAGQTESAN